MKKEIWSVELEATAPKYGLLLWSFIFTCQVTEHPVQLCQRHTVLICIIAAGEIPCHKFVALLVVEKLNIFRCQSRDTGLVKSIYNRARRGLHHLWTLELQFVGNFEGTNTASAVEKFLRLLAAISHCQFSVCFFTCCKIQFLLWLSCFA